MKEFKYTINGNKYDVAVGDKTGNNVEVTVNGEKYSVELEEKKAAIASPAAKPAAPKAAAPKSVATPASVAAADVKNTLKAPLPGTVIEILVNVGDEVKEGQTLLILEAMKMKNELQAEHDGKVSAILVGAGQAVMADDPLIAY